MIFYLHFASINTLRSKVKQTFYQISTKYTEPSKSNVNLFRTYKSFYDPRRTKSIDKSIYDYYLSAGISFKELIDLNDFGKHYIDESLRMIAEKGTNKFANLDIWDFDFLKLTGLKDPRNPVQKMLHFYLRKTQKKRDSIFIRGIDKLFKKLGY